GSGDGDDNRPEGGSGDRGDPARAVNGRVQHQLHGGGDGRGLGPAGDGRRVGGLFGRRQYGHDDQRHGHLHGGLQPGRKRQLQPGAPGGGDDDRPEGGAGDHGDAAGAGRGRVQHQLHGSGDGRGLGPTGDGRGVG